MTKPPLARLFAAVLCIAGTQPVVTFAGSNDSGYESSRRTTTTYSSVEMRELARRRDYVERGRAALQAGKKAMADKDYETAVSQYKLACDLIPNAAETRGLYAEAIHGFCKASCRFAEQRIAEGRYADATNQLKLVLDDRYHPGCREAVIILSHLET
ncbi:MAG: type II and III secretion system protein, partial [Opitutaceae bacterium]